ncbi:MAG: hypothetical protein A2600_08465 [Candidatus Lambdaproteobacteria bacterium RIFOXYD1_FULL_56_27]|uniref:V-type ATP synthase subunit D n=1 Tax=Candidatus Lambdaproteobacteria bacterium RIFOXYD2_FULL_56_26 TaxID=1817773 RepID=A0A1F6GMD8_9PROT|nr:MAG: hypothetical protein A2557_10205 [Candidatus Lambdaproteobacteria bacterium RIFOXYD2_FULL_56_26]OGH01776.1 MAG: hypothetical protein A2426_14120 [Candidatus Lambdaproteobacteria bacterium RIFOXYC1_FULL_56_13]OGH07926.1 MAG: hypothetical protein A2600_08465 [Candidatus Lambdaproteobacteria bacterium RIFOXYD1_FULL_56_27]
MAKVKLTKTELKRQKDQLKTLRRYLPTLQVKKQLLQRELLLAKARIEELELRAKSFWKDLNQWISCFGEPLPLEEWVFLESIEVEMEAIAGIEVPRLKSLKISTKPYNLYQTPLWVDKGVKALEELTSIQAEITLAFEAEQLLADELRVTSQRVNLFEKVKIPEAKTLIKTISTYLDDQAAAAVGWARGAKKKLAAKTLGQEA